MKSTLIAIAATAMMASTGAVAQSYQPYQPYQRDHQSAQNDRWDDRAQTINEREARINARIQRGMSDGRINDWEARRLYGELRDIEAKERAFKDDGRLSRRETETLNRDLDRLADHVRQEMRD